MTPSWLQHLTREAAGAERTANLFGVILYTDRHRSVARVLADEHNWKALHELSGTRWNVFAARGEAGSRNKGFLRSVWKEPSANQELLEQFGLKSTESFPVLMLFVEDAEGNLRQRAVPIRGETDEEVFQSLSSALQTVAKTLSGFLDENLRVETRAFDRANAHLTEKERWERLKKIPGIFGAIKSLAKKIIL